MVGIDMEPYRRPGDIVESNCHDGFAVDTRDVAFEFQLGATEMLVIET